MKGLGIGNKCHQHNIVDLFPGSPTDRTHTRLLIFLYFLFIYSLLKYKLPNYCICINNLQHACDIFIVLRCIPRASTTFKTKLFFVEILCTDSIIQHSKLLNIKYFILPRKVPCMFEFFLIVYYYMLLVIMNFLKCVPPHAIFA